MIYTFSRIVRRELTREELPEKAVALNITPSVDTFSGSVLTPAHVMAFVQRSWRISEAGSADANLIFATYKVPGRGRLILGAFKFGRSDSDNPDRFQKSDFAEDEGKNRRIFLAEPAPEADWLKYVGLYLPDSDDPERNPVRYYES